MKRLKIRGFSMKLFVSLFSCIFLLSNYLYAQDTLFVKQIPLGSKVSVFTEKFISDGLTYDRELSGDFVTSYDGLFMGKEAVVSLEFNKDSCVYRVIIFHKYEKWATLVSGYDGTKRRYSQKYGKPTKSLGKFYSPYREGDGFELEAIADGKCIYACYWEMKAGSIAIAICNIGSDYYVSIAYVDKKYLTEMEEQANSDI